MANVWENAVITNKGIALQAKMLAGGKAVKITSVKSGSGSVQVAALMNQENVSGIKQSLTIKPLQKIDHTVILTAMLTNDGVTSAYDLRQVGFYAEDPDEGEILYMIAQNTESRHVPTEAEVPGYSLIWNFHLTLSNGVNIEVNVNPAGYVTEGNLEYILSKLDIATMTGETIVATDSFEAPLYDLSVFGKSTQDGIPTPDAPVDIENVADDGNLKVAVRGKNLFKVTPSTQNGVTLSKYDDYYVLNGTATESGNFVSSIGKLPKGTYTLTANNPTNNEVGWSLVDVYSANPYSIIAVKDNVNNGKITTELEESNEYLCRVRIEKGVTYSNFIIKPQLEFGSVATEYEEYKEQVFILSTPNGLHGIPVSSGGNYTDQNGQQWICDEIDLERGVYVQRVKNTTVGTAGYLTDLSNGNKGLVVTPPYKIYENGIGLICTHARFERERTFVNGTCYENAGNVVICGTSDDTLQTLNTKYANATLMYVLATPVETPLTDAEIKAYRALYTNHPITTILNDSNAGMMVKYATSEIGAIVAELASMRVLSQSDVVDHLESTSAKLPLSANQGRLLNNNKAPNNHASSATTYGKGTSSYYGHVKLSDSTTSTTAAASGGTAATPKAVALVANEQKAVVTAKGTDGSFKLASGAVTKITLGLNSPIIGGKKPDGTTYNFTVEDGCIVCPIAGVVLVSGAVHLESANNLEQNRGCYIKCVHTNGTETEVCSQYIRTMGGNGGVYAGCIAISVNDGDKLSLCARASEEITCHANAAQTYLTATYLSTN